PGNFATNIQAGAKYGYALLWVVLMANVIAMLFQALSAKLGIVTGRNLAEMCREHFPQPVVWALWIISEVGDEPGGAEEFTDQPKAAVEGRLPRGYGLKRHGVARPMANAWISRLSLGGSARKSRRHSRRRSAMLSSAKTARRSDTLLVRSGALPVALEPISGPFVAPGSFCSRLAAAV